LAFTAIIGPNGVLEFVLSDVLIETESGRFRDRLLGQGGSDYAVEGELSDVTVLHNAHTRYKGLPWATDSRGMAWWNLSLLYVAARVREFAVIPASAGQGLV
jgi:hypothetical protein